MRDPARIKRLCKLLEEAWTKQGTDQRFGQFLSNYIVSDGQRLFYIEDYDWERLLRKLAGHPMSAHDYKQLKDEAEREADRAWDAINRAMRDVFEADRA